MGTHLPGKVSWVAPQMLESATDSAPGAGTQHVDSQRQRVASKNTSSHPAYPQPRRRPSRMHSCDAAKTWASRQNSGIPASFASIAVSTASRSGPPTPLVKSKLISLVSQGKGLHHQLTHLIPFFSDTRQKEALATKRRSSAHVSLEGDRYCLRHLSSIPV